MSLPIFVEILTPDGEVKSRHAFPSLPIRIGRAYDNDIIIDDPHIAAHHAHIERAGHADQGELLINDLGSLSGISHRNQRAASFVIDGNHHYRLGRTLIRIRTRDYPVAPELTDTTNHHWEGWRPALAGTLLVVLTALLTTWLSDTDEKTTSDYAIELVGVVGVMLCWSGIWAMFSRLFSGHARFGRHLWIASGGLVVLELWDQLSGMVAYALSWETLATFSNHPMLVIFALILYFHLRTAGNKHPGRLKILLATLTVISSAVIMTKQYQSTHHLASQLYLNELYPPALRVSRDQGLDEFIQGVNTLQSRVDDLRKKSDEQEPNKGPTPKAPAKPGTTP